MKAEALTDTTIQLPKARVIIELPNGQHTAVTGFIVDSDRRGDTVITLKTGKKIKYET